MGGRKDRAPHRTLAMSTTVEGWRARLLAHLADRQPRTFNRLGVELLDQTADMLYRSVVDRALWSLVDDQLLEHTLEVPIFFRLAVPCEGAPEQDEADFPHGEVPRDQEG
jgi:hypothetical protein